MMSKKFFVISLILFSLIVNGISFVVHSDPITVSDSLVKSDFLITKESDYKSFGFFNVVDPVVYESEVLCEGNLPLVISFDKAVTANSFFSSSENMKSNINDIRYVYQILFNESYIYRTPVYKTVKEIQIIKGNASNGTRDKEIVVESQVIDYYKNNTGFRWVWKDIKSFESMSISKDKFVVLNVKGFFKPNVGKRSVDIVPCFTIGNEKQELSKYAWWSSSWGYRKTITLNHSQVPATLTNFPVLINLTDTDLRDYAQNDGDDIAFTSSSGVQLNHEIELFNGTSGQLVVWVNVTSLSNVSDTVIYMYYNNSVASNQEDVVNTWDSYYLHVWHMNGSSTEYDSKTLKNNGNVTGADIVSGKIGYGRGFIQANSDYISYGDLTYPADGSLATATFECCLYHIDAVTSEILDKYLANQYSYMFRMPATEKLHFSMYSNNLANYWTYATTNALNVNSKWVHLAVSVEATGETCIMYLNGSSVAVTKTENGGTGPSAFPTSTTSDYTGRLSAVTPQYSTMSLDELRVSRIQRSVGWISAGSNNIRNSTSGGFYIIGSQETSNYLPVISNENPLNESVNNPLSLTWNCTITEGDGDIFNWSIDCSNGQSISMNGASNGSKSLPLTGLAYYTNYTVWVNATDGIGWTNETFWFWTQSECPEYLNYSTNYSIWFCVNVSDDLDDIDFLNVSLYNSSQYETWSAVHNGTFCVLFNNLTVGIDYIVNISVFDGFCWTNSSEIIVINEGGITDLNILLSGLSIENGQLFLFILLTLWIYFLKEYLDKHNSPNGSMLAKIQLALAFPLTIQLAIISFSFVFGYILVFIIPVLAIYIFLDSTIYMKNNKK